MSSLERLRTTLAGLSLTAIDAERVNKSETGG
jgi:hypothetical protein